MARSDSELVQGCLSGEASAWEELIDRYARLIYSIPRRLSLSHTDADDIFQTVATILLRRLDTLHEVERLSTWLIRTTYRESWRVVKRRKTDERRGVECVELEESPTDDRVAELERQQIVRQSLARIDERCRGLLEALFFESPPPAYETIAARLNMKVGSIGPTRARCFQKLETLLREYGL